MPTASTQTPAGDYCGSKTPPAGRHVGTPSYCYKKGVRSGFVAGIQKGTLQGTTLERKRSAVRSELIQRGEQQRTQQATRKAVKEAVPRIEATTKAMTRGEIAKAIETKGLTTLKRQLHLNRLTKDEIRSLATRYTGTANAITRYSTLTQDQLKQELRNRGWQD